MVLFSLTHNPWIGAVLGMGIGLCGVWINISANTLLQRIVPDRARGRIFGIVDLANMSGMVLATSLLGIVHIPHLDLGIGWILRGFGAVLLIAGLLLWRHHHRRGGLPFTAAFLRGFNEVVCRLWYRLRRVGPCTVPLHGPCIIAANHTCGADPCFLAASSPNRLFGYMIAVEYCDLPIIGWMIRFLGCIRVRRDGHDLAATRQALRQLQSDQALGIFVQGRIPGPEGVGVPQEGAAVLAMRSGASVIPVHISGVKYQKSISRVFFKRHRVRVCYGPPVNLSDLSNPRDREQVAAATSRIWEAIQALGPEDGMVYI
jgi:1-acyl-sn-glycerol-3-phosphate acyltransferase